MTIPRRLGRLILTAVMIGMLAELLACSGGSATAPSAELAALRQQVAAQATQIALLETRGAAAQTRVAVLEARGATLQATAQVKPAAGGATETPKPTPTIVPVVAGLAADGTTKGAATAPVTITEFTNYF